ncbi:MAG: M48 family metallopeptidase [Elusimicrobia bacterium]|nr:M48 family metallopeptidase [Elusimicrobiota bacterium]
MRPRLCALAALSLLAACQTVPYTGRHHMILVSSTEEINMGEQAAQDILKKAKLSHDEADIAMIRRVGERLARAADRPDYQWAFYLIDDPKTVNAFCLPGGKVFVYSGILPVTRDEQGMAVVLGHEISHALARHGAERMSQGMVADAGGRILDVALGGSNPAAHELYDQAYQVGVGVGVLLPFSRRQESEADHIGLILMAKAGYDPDAAVGFWGRMEQEGGGGGGGGLGAFLRTHPPDAQRLEQIRRWLPGIKARYYRPAP